MTTVVLVLLVLFVHAFTPSSSSSSSQTYNILNYGAKPGGETDSTTAFLSAWQNTCGSSSPATLYVPPGRFLLGNVAFEGPCLNNDTLVSIDGTVAAPSDSQVIGDAAYWILFEHVDGVTVSGGILDGRASALSSACKAAGRSCPTGIRVLGFSNSTNIVVSGLTSISSPVFHIFIDFCQNVKVSGVELSTLGDSPHAGGIRVESSTDVTISNSKIETGDSCVSYGPGAHNISIENVVCQPSP